MTLWGCPPPHQIQSPQTGLPSRSVGILPRYTHLLQLQYCFLQPPLGFQFFPSQVSWSSVGDNGKYSQPTSARQLIGTYLPFVGCVATYAPSFAFFVLRAGVIGMLTLPQYRGKDQSGKSADSQDERAGKTQYDSLMISAMY